MLRSELRNGWTVRAIGGDPSRRVPGTYPVEVPGSVHTDLMKAGVIPDPYLDAVEDDLRMAARGRGQSGPPVTRRPATRRFPW